MSEWLTSATDGNTEPLVDVLHLLTNGTRIASPGTGDEDLLFVWDQYVQFESEASDSTPNRVRFLYERAVAQCFLNPQIW